MKPWRRDFLRAVAAGLAGPMAFEVLGAEMAVVDIRDYKFIPATLKVKTGTTVKWTNSEKRTTHSILFVSAPGLESERFFPGESWQYRFDKPGVYPYTCGPHPEMKGVVEVAD